MYWDVELPSNLSDFYSTPDASDDEQEYKKIIEK